MQTSMAATPSPARPLPSRAAALVFSFKANILRLRRFFQNVAAGIQRHGTASPAGYPVKLAECVTPLWTDTLLAEAQLQLGKVQNLRQACARLHRTAIPAGQTFSFWKQIGPTTRAKGYTAGRMLQEGCIIPAIGGGLCQLSNALYDVCLSAGCQILERHPHSSVIPGSAAALGRDATVAWNYVDFRFRAPVPLFIESFLQHDELVVRLCAAVQSPRMRQTARAGLPNVVVPPSPHANSCESCGQHTCFRHVEFFAGPRVQTKSAFLLNECWPEFHAYLNQKQQPGDLFAHPINSSLPRYACPSPPAATEITSPLATLWRSWQTRRHAHHVPSRVAAQFNGARAIARRFAKSLTSDVTTVYVEQSLLPYLWQDMQLGGRTLKVFMTRLPLAHLHQTLDAAFQLHPERTTLSELRAAPEIVEAESEALAYAAQVITPHTHIASLFPNRVELLAWHTPAIAAPPRDPKTNLIAFPGPTVARKGAYELRAAARDLNLEILTLGNELEGPDFWHGIPHRRTTLEDALIHAAAFVQPALIEDKPRVLLKAIAAGVPVIASDACGLPPSPLVRLISSPRLAEALSSCTLHA